MHAFGEEEPAAVGENARYSTGFRAFQHWSPLIVPLMLGGILLGVTLLITAHGMAQPYSPAWEWGAEALVALAVLGGALLGAVLKAAPTDSLWLGALVAGSMLYIAVMLCAVLGPLAGLLPFVVVAGAGFQFVRTHRYAVGVGTIVLTERRSGYLRTLYPGTNLLWPGEHVLATLETGLRLYISPTQRAQVRAMDGTHYSASASAIVSFGFIPTEAHAVARMLDTWERDLHQLIAVALREALQQWSAHEVVTGGQAPAGLVARWVLDEVRGWARASGIWVAWVRVCHLQLGPAWESLPAPTHSRGAPVAVSVMRGVRSDTGYATRSTPPPASMSLCAAPAGHARTMPRLPAVRANASTTPARAAQDSNDPPVDETAREEQERQRNADLEHLTPDSLADLYESIRDGHINDPATIREVAHAFARLAQAPPADAELPYDAASAADALLQFAAQIEHHSTSVERASRHSYGTDLYAPTQDLPLGGIA
jgi:hypothetical protein